MTRVLFVIACVATLLTCGDLYAQRRVPGYVNRPTLSPFIGLFRADNGGLNSYFSYVRPRIQAEQFMRDTRLEADYNQNLIQQESLQVQRSIHDAASAMELELRPTSSARGPRRPAGRFMQFGTFYPSSNASPPRRGR